MEKLQILNTREVKPITSYLKEHFGFSEKLDYVFLQNRKDKVFVVNRDIGNIDLDKVRINSIGIYFAKFEKDGIRLSIEGSQIIGPKSGKNVVDLDDEQIKSWLAGEDIEVSGEFEGFVIIKHKKDFFGCGKFRDNRVLNHVPKARRVKI